THLHVHHSRFAWIRQRPTLLGAIEYAPAVALAADLPRFFPCRIADSSWTEDRRHLEDQRHLQPVPGVHSHRHPFSVQHIHAVTYLRRAIPIERDPWARSDVGSARSPDWVATAADRTQPGPGRLGITGLSDRCRRGASRTELEIFAGDRR